MDDTKRILTDGNLLAALGSAALLENRLRKAAEKVYGLSARLIVAISEGDKERANEILGELETLARASGEIGEPQ
jgi:hypothetical protein